MSVCFSTRSSLRGSQRKEREKGGKMSLFSLKKLSLFLSLSLSFFDTTFWRSRFVFFSSSLLHSSFRWVKVSSVGLPLSFSLVFVGEIGNHIIRSSLSLSLLRRARVLENPISLSNTPSSTQKERGMIISEKKEEISTRLRYKLARAKAGKKKDGLDFSSH